MQTHEFTVKTMKIDNIPIDLDMAKMIVDGLFVAEHESVLDARCEVFQRILRVISALYPELKDEIKATLDAIPPNPN